MFHSRVSLDVDLDLVGHSVTVFVLEVSKVEGATGLREDHLNDFSKLVCS